MNGDDEARIREKARTIDTANEARLSYDPGAAELLLGATVAERYTLEKLLAVGGMGLLYRATDGRGGPKVVVKTLRPELAENRVVVDRFVREYEACRTVRSPHLVEFLTSGNLADGRAYYVMELLDGFSLADLLRMTEGDIAPPRVIRIAHQMALALEAAHAAGLVHRDLKPDNVIVCPLPDGSEYVKILDFGLAKAVDGSMDVTRAGEVVGTPHYMSPEQIRGMAMDYRTDIYSFGIILYEMLTGEVPFDGEALIDIMLKHVEQEPVLPSKRTPPIKIPVQLEWIIMCCLYKEAKRRFRSATELREELENVGRLYHIELARQG
ncbi:MAG: serine/threonine-protein kinase [Sandaracinaceae bacterium]